MTARYLSHVSTDNCSDENTRISAGCWFVDVAVNVGDATRTRSIRSDGYIIKSSARANDDAARAPSARRHCAGGDRAGRSVRVVLPYRTLFLIGSLSFPGSAKSVDEARTGGAFGQESGKWPELLSVGSRSNHAGRKRPSSLSGRRSSACRIPHRGHADRQSQLSPEISGPARLKSLRLWSRGSFPRLPFPD